MKIKKFSWVKLLLFGLLGFLLIAATPFQDVDPETPQTWRGVLTTAIGVIILLAGSPITQLFKNIFGVKDKLAIFLTGVVALGISVLELWLMGLLDFKLLTVDSFPDMFFLVFTVSTFYFKLLKDKKEGITGFFGGSGLLKS